MCIGIICNYLGISGILGVLGNDWEYLGIDG
jgi:hypothetical protein